jgi:hypothetical protein
MTFYQFNSETSEKNYIHMIGVENAIFIESYGIDEEKQFEFCKMLTEAFDEIHEKGYIVHRQYINKSDLKFIAHIEEWRVIEDEGNELLIECDIQDAPKCIIEGFMETNIPSI